MAARFWRWLLLCQLLYAAAMSSILALATALSPAALLLVALAALLSAPLLLVAGTFVLGYFTVRAPERPAGALELLRALFGESLALEAAALRMVAEPYRRPICIDLPVLAAPARPVLLIHGIVCNCGVWRPLLERLQALGYAPVRAVNLEPLLADIDTHTAGVVRELEDLQRQSNGAPVAIVAHSMGGLVARAALRMIGPATISRIVTIASPHHGSGIARLFRSRPARQLRPDSSWLRALNAGEGASLEVPVTSIYSLHDNLIVPPRSAMLAGARLHELRGIGHLRLLTARQSIDHTLAALAGA